MRITPNGDRGEEVEDQHRYGFVLLFPDVSVRERVAGKGCAPQGSLMKGDAGLSEERGGGRISAELLR